jgi:NADH-ubiquinone oxidoreductase chain 3
MTSLIFYILFIAFLAFALLALNLLLAPHSPYNQKDSQFECGFSSFRGQNRSEFSISFFLFGLLFLLFDLEILLIFPYSVSSYNNSSYGLFFVVIFLLILTVGFVYEIGRGALKINSKQTGYLSKANFESDSSDISNTNHIKVKKSGGKPNLYAHQQRSYTTAALRGFTSPIANVSPERIYRNADTDKVKILIENKHKAGVYRWTNTQNGKSYIGSALDLKFRFIQYYNINHLIDNNCMLICRALVKYGYSKFRLEILEYCDEKIRIERENYYLNLCQPKYNIVKQANSMPSRKGYRHKEETKSKIKNSQPTRITVLVTDIVTKVETVYDSFHAAAIALNCSDAHISKYFKKNQQKPLKQKYILKKIASPVLEKSVKVEKS